MSPNDDDGASQEVLDTEDTQVRETRSASLRFTLVLSAVVLVMMAHYFVREGDIKWAVTPLVISVGCLVLASGRSRSAHLADQSPEDSSNQSMYGLETRLGILAAAVSVGLIYLSLRNFADGERQNLTLAWWSFSAAVALILAAIPTVDGRWTALVDRLRVDGSLRFRLNALVPWVLLTLILVLAAGLRLYNLDDLPAGLWFDEADNLTHARHYVHNPGQIPVYEPSTNLPSMFLLPIAAVVKLAGISITSGRLVAVAFGLLGIAATFILVRHAISTSTALFAAFFVATMRWDINWSRIGMHGITGVLFAALIAWLTLRALRTGRATDFAFAGASLGLGMWFYTSIRMFPLVLGFILIHHLLVRHPPPRQFASRVLVMALTALFVAAPVVQFALDNPARFFDRTQTTSVFELTPRDQWADRLGTSIVRHSLMFNQRGDPNPRHNLPNEPMLDFVTGSLFLLGFFFSLTRWRQVALLCLPFWVFLMVLPGVLTVPWEMPQSLRSILVIPAVAALAAIVVDTLWRSLRNAPWHWVRRVALSVVLALLGMIAYLNVNFYFGDQASHPEVYAAFSTDETLMVRSQIEQQRLGYSLWVSRQFLFGRTGALLANNPRYEVISAPETLPLDSTQVWRGTAVYFEPREEGFWHTMRSYYPDARFHAVAPPHGYEPMYYAGFVSREQLAERQGLDVTYTADGDEVEGRRDTVSESSWHAYDGPGRYPYTVTLDGALHIQEEGEYEFVLDARTRTANVSVELDGHQVLGAGKTRTKVLPAVGLHTLTIRAEVEGPGGSVGVSWVPPGGELTSIPFGRLYRGTVRPVGLAGRFYQEGQTANAPHSMHVTPSMDLFYYEPVAQAPYVGIWEGTLDVRDAGFYRFRVARWGTGTVEIYIDDALIARDPPSRDMEIEGEVGLSAGRHHIRVEYRPESATSQFEITWAPPGRSFGPIPVELMRPAPERMLLVVD